METPRELLESVRKILNETRQDPACRGLLEGRPAPALLPFLGNAKPVFLFLGANPAGYTLEDVPNSAEDYIDFAREYFACGKNDRGSFAHYLPYTANTSGDYATFGEVSMVAHLVPIPTPRSSDISEALVQACWARFLTLLMAVSPKLIVAHGALVWKFLAGLRPFGEPRLLDVPETHHRPLKELFAAVKGEQLPFPTRMEGLAPDFKTWILPLPHLGKAAPGRRIRDKCELGAATARRHMHGRKAGARLRVRRPNG